MNIPTTPAMKATLELAEVLADTRKATGTTTIPELTREEAVAVQSSVAQKLLQTDGWNILRELFRINSEMLNTTQLFVLPVIAQEELIREKLGEHYAAFEKDFAVLREDLALMANALLALSKRHLERKGDVAEEDQALIVELASGYSNLQTQMENKVSGELAKQMEILEVAGVGADVLYTAFVELQEIPESV